jgi:hypothetical protein
LGIAVVLSGVMSVMSMIPKVQTQLMADSLGRASTHLLEIALLFSMIPSLMSQLIDPAAYQVEVSKNPNYFAGASVCSVIALMLIAQHIYGCSNKRPVLKDAPTAAQEAARLAKKTKNCCSRLCASKKPQTADNDNELRTENLLTQ